MAMGGKSWLATFLKGGDPTSTALRDMGHHGERSVSGSLKCKHSTDDDAKAHEDDDWSDISSEGASGSSDPKDDSRPDGGSPDTNPDDEARLLPYMPTLFSKDLPPCGPIPQVAYEKVNLVLRKIWLQLAAARSVDIPILDICLLVKMDMEAEAKRLPPVSELKRQERRAWHRENILQYELGWAKYFAREAEVMQKKPKMSEAERDKQDFVDRLYPIPKELHIYIQNVGNKKKIPELWKAWHQKKRGATDGVSSSTKPSTDYNNGDSVNSEQPEEGTLNKPEKEEEEGAHVQGSPHKV